MPSILQHAGDALLLVVSNPVDIMTHLAAHFAGSQGVSSTRVIGSGTMLDTARFRSLLGVALGWTRNTYTPTSSVNTVIRRCKYLVAADR